MKNGLGRNVNETVLLYIGKLSMYLKSVRIRAILTSGAIWNAKLKRVI